MKKAKKLLVANWKMNPQSVVEAKRLFIDVKKTASRLSNVETVIAPPFVFLPILRELYAGHRISFSGQDVFFEKSGSYTGEISASMLKEVGAEYCIIGHSERRARGESDEDIQKKVDVITTAGLTAILCIGESERDHSNGTHLSFLTDQIKSALGGLTGKQMKQVVIAYEPIWAIGKSESEAMQPRELHETVLFIRKTLSKLFDVKVAQGTKILYGGSAESGNTESLLQDGEADGLLVGHASLSATEFSEMLRIAQSIK